MKSLALALVIVIARLVDSDGPDCLAKTTDLLACHAEETLDRILKLISCPLRLHVAGELMQEKLSSE